MEADVQLLKRLVEQQNRENLVVDDLTDQFRHAPQRGFQVERGVDHVGHFQQQGFHLEARKVCETVVFTGFIIAAARNSSAAEKLVHGATAHAPAGFSGGFSSTHTSGKLPVAFGIVQTVADHVASGIVKPM